jgi:hypothetical protein
MCIKEHCEMGFWIGKSYALDEVRFDLLLEPRATDQLTAIKHFPIQPNSIRVTNEGFQRMF